MKASQILRSLITMKLQKSQWLPKQKNVLVVLVTRVFLFGPVSVEKCDHRHTILGRKWAQLFEGRFSLTWGVISFSFVLKHFLRQFLRFFRVSNHQTVYKKNKTKLHVFFFFGQKKKKQRANCSAT